MGMVVKNPAGVAGSAMPTAWSKVAEQKENISYTIPAPGYYRLNFNYVASADYFINSIVNGISVLPPADSLIEPCGLRNIQAPGRGATFSVLLLAEVEGGAYKITEVTTGYPFGIRATISGGCNNNGGTASFTVWRAIE